MLPRPAVFAATALAFCIVAAGAQANGLTCAIPGAGATAPHCLDGAGIAPIDAKEKPPLSAIRHMTACGDRLVIANTSEVAFREAGGNWVKPPRHGKFAMQALGCDAKGAIFVAYKDGIVRFEGGQWTDTPYTALNVANGMLDGVKRFVAKPDGSLWAVLGKGLAHYENGTWTPIAERPPLPNEHVRFTDAAADKDGRLWLLYGGGLAMHDGRTWTAHREPLTGASGIAVDGSGTVWVAVHDGIRTFSGGAWRRALLGGVEPQIKVRDLAFDGKGRLWLATSWGLAVVEGNVARFWRMANSDAPFDDVRSLIVAGDGAASLPPIQDKPTGGIKGKIEGDGNAGLENLRVEFCNVRLSRFTTFRAGDTPCSTQAPLTFTTRTGKDGAFSVDQVPPGDYSIVVERDAGKWVLITGSIGISAEFVRVASDKVTSIPTITLKPR